MKIVMRVFKIIAWVFFAFGILVLWGGIELGNGGMISAGIGIPLICLFMFSMLGKQEKIMKAQQLLEGEIRFGGLVSKTTFNEMPVGVACQISLIGETVTLKAGNRSFSIQKNQILAADTYGARTNAAGIVITGITGADSKQKTTQHFYSYINFKSTSGEIHQVDFEVYPPIRQVDMFNKEVSSKVTTVTKL